MINFTRDESRKVGDVMVQMERSNNEMEHEFFGNAEPKGCDRAKKR